jgi:hypothetical protein
MQLPLPASHDVAPPRVPYYVGQGGIIPSDWSLRRRTPGGHRRLYKTDIDRLLQADTPRPVGQPGNIE